MGAKFRLQAWSWRQIAALLAHHDSFALLRLALLVLLNAHGLGLLGNGRKFGAVSVRVSCQAVMPNFAPFPPCAAQTANPCMTGLLQHCPARAAVRYHGLAALSSFLKPERNGKTAAPRQLLHVEADTTMQSARRRIVCSSAGGHVHSSLRPDTAYHRRPRADSAADCASRAPAQHRDQRFKVLPPTRGPTRGDQISSQECSSQQVAGFIQTCGLSLS
jgi:hypothetical protein